MKKIVFIPTAVIIVCLLVCSFTIAQENKIEEWETHSCETTSKIKLITETVGEDRKSEIVKRIENSGFKIDELKDRIITTKPYLDSDRKWLIFRFELLDDNIIVISGEWSKKSSPDLQASTLSEWKTIQKLTSDEYGSREYEVMTVLTDGIKRKSVLYNKYSFY